ncbi:DUF2510 domain-containing protein [Cryobacterium glaciale]|uniref:DUF2510 domain-containing protein n=1 Tax=Cryobacterium glaciale TaxID=1259145 RepID=UPI001A7ECC51|nr:DUF2510 domain-containing protein [Cryobacterium glaciale]
MPISDFSLPPVQTGGLVYSLRCARTGRRLIMAVAGWYRDPKLPGDIRWWDGFQWTADTKPRAQVPPGAPPGPPQPVYLAQPQQVPPSPYATPLYMQPQGPVQHWAPPYQHADPVVAAIAFKPPAGLALTSAILGGIAILFGWFIPAAGLLCGPAGLVFGIVALVKSSGARAGTVSSATSRPLAITGTVVSGAALLFAIGAAVVWAGINSL